VKIFAHELSEALTDPELNAWINSGFIENGDLCVWTFGMTKLLPNGSSYNVIFGTRPYLSRAEPKEFQRDHDRRHGPETICEVDRKEI
jgi:hypothetical protein